MFFVSNIYLTEDALAIKDKKILIVVIFGLISCGNVFANGKILKSGFITKSASVNESMEIKDPKNLEKVTQILFSNKRKMINKNIKKKLGGENHRENS